MPTRPLRLIPPMWTTAIGIVVSGLSVLPPAPLAHVGGSTGYASIVVSGNTVRYSLTLSASALPPC